MRRAPRALLSIIAVLLLLASCGTDSRRGTDGVRTTGESVSSPTHPSPTSSSQDATTGAPAFTENMERQSGEGSGRSDLVLVDVHVAESEGFDRIVLEFSGTGTPGWVVDYVDEGVLDGSGEVVALGGTAALDIYASGTTWPAPDYYSGPRQFTPQDGGEVIDVYVGGTFEGHTQVLAGIDSDPVPFRVFALAAPARLVIDVADENAE